MPRTARAIVMGTRSGSWSRAKTASIAVTTIRVTPIHFIIGSNASADFVDVFLLDFFTVFLAIGDSRPLRLKECFALPVGEDYSVY